MISLQRTIAVAILACGLHTQTLAAASKEEGHATANPDHARLTAARKAANELPEVLAIQQQSYADRALSHKAYAEYKSARKRSATSEDAYKKAFEEGLTKVDAGAVPLLEKERVAFRERMLNARNAKKGSSSKKVPIKAEEDGLEDEEERPDEEK
jgi:hypothetical protein